MQKILFIDNTAHHVYGQRHLMHAYKRSGYAVIVATPNDGDYFNQIQNDGFTCIDFKLEGKSLNPLKELYLLYRIHSLINKIKPTLICSFTIKPNIYVGLSNKFTKVKNPIIANITGLGTVFMHNKLLKQVGKILYKVAFKEISHTFCQNKDDFTLLNQAKVFKENQKIEILPGDGVDLEKFHYVGLTNKPNTTFLYSGRLLYDKGLSYLVNAFAEVKQKHPQTRLIIIGSYFESNPSAISKEQIQKWIDSVGIEYLGMTHDVRPIIEQSDCTILASLREGLPRCLLESCAMGKPIITVNSPGCKEVVQHEVTGYLAKPKDITTLKEAMINYIELPFEKKVIMSKAARKKMETEFDQQIVVNKYITTTQKLIMEQ